MGELEVGQSVSWMTWAALLLGALLAALVGLGQCGRSRWAAATQALWSQLEASRLPAISLRYDAEEIQGLPAPVQRYFRAVLQDGQPIVTAATVRHNGTFSVTALSRWAMWFPFTSEQRVVTRRPGFVWNARMALLPGIAVHVHDAYVAGVGSLHAAALGLFTLGRQQGRAEFARGELMRYMMEATWYPTALLPSQGTAWVAVDETSADATMVDGELSLTMRYSFGADGLVTRIVAAARGALVGGKLLMLPWEGLMSNYQERHGMRVPLSGEAAWLTLDGRKPYWRGTITSAVYEFSC